MENTRRSIQDRLNSQVGKPCSCATCGKNLIRGYMKPCFVCKTVENKPLNYVAQLCWLNNAVCSECRENQQVIEDEIVSTNSKKSAALHEENGETPSEVYEVISGETLLEAVEETLADNEELSDNDSDSEVEHVVENENEYTYDSENELQKESDIDKSDKVDAECAPNSDNSKSQDDSVARLHAKITALFLRLAVDIPNGMSLEEVLKLTNRQKKLIVAQMVKHFKKEMKKNGHWKHYICWCGLLECICRSPKFTIDSDKFLDLEQYCTSCGQNAIFNTCPTTCIECHLNVIFGVDTDADSISYGDLLSPSASRSSDIAKSALRSPSSTSSKGLSTPPRIRFSPQVISMDVAKQSRTTTPTSVNRARRMFCCVYPGCNNDFYDSCKECPNSEDACYCFHHMVHSLYHSGAFGSTSASSSSSSASSSLASPQIVVPLEVPTFSNRGDATAFVEESIIPRAEFPAMVDSTVHGFMVNGEMRYYISFQFDRSRIVSKPPSYYWLQLHAESTYFSIYNHVLYGACMKGRSTIFSRCYVYNMELKEHRYILMRIMSTTCDKPNRLFYLYDTITKHFTKVQDNFWTDKMISDPSKLYNDDKLEAEFRDWCNNMREIYDPSRGLKLDCKGYNRGPISAAPAIARFDPGEIDESLVRWTNINGTDFIPLPPRKRQPVKYQTPVTPAVAPKSGSTRARAAKSKNSKSDQSEDKPKPDNKRKTVSAEIISERVTRLKASTASPIVNTINTAPSYDVSHDTVVDTYVVPNVKDGRIDAMKSEIDRLQSVIASMQQSVQSLQPLATNDAVQSTSVPEHALRSSAVTGPVNSPTVTDLHQFNPPQFDDRASIASTPVIQSQHMYCGLDSLHGASESARVRGTDANALNIDISRRNETVSDQFVPMSRVQLLMVEMQAQRLDWRNQQLAEQLFMAKLQQDRR